ncbi:helix-turn-helix transcriptional regulator [Brevibacillus laterosporus]|uniref:helix-turn-helix transcriptional regulator n=1 Tax=Brevibacillus laterosporus TaxID=1465 RepID=UPI0018F889D9|nr:hypothetical protein [Brevibacillus laterosporus]MBG9774230.1 hypothetical protein [Brevibacillus laterosporus]
MSNVLERTYHPETGELGTFIPDGSHVTIQTDAQREATRQHFERERMKLVYRGLNWVACYHEAILGIIRDLTLIEAGALIKLLPFLRFKSEGKLVQDGKPLKQTDIARLLGRGKKATMAILQRLETLGVITCEKEGRTNVYYISVEFHTMGDVIDGASFTKLYQVKAREIAEELTLSELGFLYKILPFFHYQTYYLCDNPDEENPEVIRHLNREQLAERVGHDIQTVYELVNKLRNKGVVLTTTSAKTTNYLVHPDVMFRKEYEDEYTRVVRRMFEEHRIRQAKKFA